MRVRSSRQNSQSEEDISSTGGRSGGSKNQLAQKRDGSRQGKRDDREEGTRYTREYSTNMGRDWGGGDERRA